jgi:hypothetical protein
MPAADNRFDREHVAEEIEDLGKSERDAVRNQIRRIIEHLLKLAYSPAEQPRFEWMETIVGARQSLFDKLTPTLGCDVEAALDKLYFDARKRATLGLQRFGEHEAAEHLPTTCPYSWDEICQQDWYPAPAETEAK